MEQWTSAVGKLAELGWSTSDLLHLRRTPFFDTNKNYRHDNESVRVRRNNPGNIDNCTSSTNSADPIEARSTCPFYFALNEDTNRYFIPIRLKILTITLAIRTSRHL